MNSKSHMSGESHPLGATLTRGGANFSIYSRLATGVELLFFEHEASDRPSQVLRLDPFVNRTYHYWHIFVPQVRPGQIYAYRVEGASCPASVIIAPYSPSPEVKCRRS